MTQARATQISLIDTPYYHCMARCVRRAFLFGEDSVTGGNFNHRKQWIVDKLAELAEVFAIDVCAYAVMSNHYHVVLRIDAEQAEGWSDKDVMERWTQLFKGHYLVTQALKNQLKTKAERDKAGEYIETYRARLMDISWFMRCLNEHIARLANEEDQCTGRFWEGRFKSQALLDEAAVLTCMAYVDLNPVRAKLADTPETSDYTAIQARIQALTHKKAGRPKQHSPNNTTGKSVKLLPFNKGHALKEKENAIPFHYQDYLQLLDWTGRAIRDDKRGFIPADTPPILQRLGIPPDQWLNTLPNLEHSFHHGIGTEASLKRLCQHLGQRWVAGLRSARTLFRSDAGMGFARAGNA